MIFCFIVVECNAPRAPDHGSVDTAGVEFVYNQEVRYECDDGYRLQGSEFGRCNENRTWGELPVCESKPNVNEAIRADD